MNFIKVILKMEKDKVLVLIIIQMEMNLKVNGKMTKRS